MPSSTKEERAVFNAAQKQAVSMRDQLMVSKETGHLGTVLVTRVDA